MTAKDEAFTRAVTDMENGVIIQLHRVTNAAAKLTKCLATGYCDSEMVGVYADLRAASNFIEAIRNRYQGACAKIEAERKAS